VIPPTFYAIGSNYRDHIVGRAKVKGTVPKFYDRPRVGYRANSALVADGEDIVKPADAGPDFQYEGELVAVIGKTARNVTPEEAEKCIFGWTIGNDVSERTWQREDPTNLRGKNADTFKPMGPWIVTDADLKSMKTIVRLNGKTVHEFPTVNMLFSPGEVISSISRYNTLSPGDVVWLGTDEVPLNLNPGDTIEIEISGIGKLRNRVVLGK
jgi:2-keto-4-pentenoate hydratase/2-oxohepta-3-ene-1,7-dioic acid hydratase in catechol pathway